MVRDFWDTLYTLSTS